MLGRDALLQQSPEIEVEIAARFFRDLGPRTAVYTIAEVADAIASLHLAFEVISSRFQNRKATAPFSVLADGQSNGAIVYGEGIANWRAIDLGKVPMMLDFEGRTVAAAESGASTELVLHDLTWLANHVAKRSGGLRAGQVVITGARISPVSLPIGASRVRAEAPLIGTVSATFI
jgi:2-keto-4-pentenoate hydratase